MPQWGGKRVLRWMCRIGFPPLGRSDPAFVWFLRGMDPPGVDTPRAVVEQRHAELASRLLQVQDEINRELFVSPRPEWLEDIEEYPGQAAENLWRLMQGLNQPDAFAEWVEKMVLQLPQAPWLEQNQSIVRMLLAICPAQLLQRLLTRGISQDVSLDTLFRVIQQFVIQPDAKKYRRDLAKWFAEMPIKAPMQHRELIQGASDYNLPPWAASTLPGVFFFENSSLECLVWTPIFLPFQEFVLNHGAEVTFFCDHQFVCVRNAPQKAVDLIGQLCELTNSLRRKNPYNSDSVNREIVLHIIRTSKDLAAAIDALPGEAPDLNEAVGDFALRVFAIWSIDPENTAAVLNGVRAGLAA